MGIRTLVGIIVLVGGLVGLILSVVTFANNAYQLMFWPWVGSRLPLSADQIGSYGRGILVSVIGAPVSFLAMKFGWIVAGD